MTVFTCYAQTDKEFLVVYFIGRVALVLPVVCDLHSSQEQREITFQDLIWEQRSSACEVWVLIAELIFRLVVGMDDMVSFVPMDDVVVTG